MGVVINEVYFTHDYTCKEEGVFDYCKARIDGYKTEITSA